MLAFALRARSASSRQVPWPSSSLLAKIRCPTSAAFRLPNRPFSLSRRQSPSWSRYFSSTRPSILRQLEPRFFSNNAVKASESTPLPTLTPPSVGHWLIGCSLLVFGVIVVGGVTRLTESGLSITEWKPVTGIIPPRNAQEWEEEFQKYQATPEFKLLNSNITLDDFKRIYHMEFGHRMLGRLVGIAFTVPLVYFVVRRRLSRPLPAVLTGMATLIGLQGALGWYMVKSGLDEALTTTPGTVPRVSQYRLAAHLGAAFVLYASMLSTGVAVLRDWKFSTGSAWNGPLSGLQSPQLRRFRIGAWALTGLVFLTALSGAFVAGLDAGLLYNTFPTMGGRLAPPKDEMMSLSYARKPDGSDMWWRNILENPTTVQFDHRLLATTTYLSTTGLWLWSRSSALRASLPPLTKRVASGAFHMANLQVALGISTLLYLVPVPLAASHQAGSVVLLSMMVLLLGSLRRPGQAAVLWRNAGRQRLVTP